MIVLEGVDKSGKTTLKHEILKQYDLPTYHFGIPSGDPTFDYSHFMQKQDEPCLIDRFFYGERPYSITKKRKVYMDYIAFRILQLQMETFPHLIIYCRPTREELQMRHEKEPDSYINLGELNTLYEEYDIMFEEVFNDVTYCRNVMDIPLDNALSPAWERFGKWKQFKWPGIGTLTPRYLFVGERFNDGAPHQVVFWSQSGEYLMRALDEADIDMRHCHFTNAAMGFVNKISHEYINFLNPQVVIALGDVAWDAIRKFPKGKLCHMPHPSYYRRFMATADNRYAEELRKCTL